MDKKKKFIIFGVVLLLIVVSGITYAILTWNSTMVKIGINTNCFTIDYTKGGDITGSLKLMNENDLISSGKFTIKEGIGISGVNIGIKSSCSIEGLGNIYLNVSNISNALTTGDSKGALKYVVLKNTSSISNPSDISVNSLLNQSFDIAAIGSVDSSDKKLLYYTELSNTEIYKYIIAIYIDKALAGNDITEATFSGNISSDAEQLVATPDYCFNVVNKDDTNMTASINDYYCYEGNSKGYDVITDVVIPKEIDGYEIISILGNNTDGGRCQRGSQCFISAYNISSVIIPNTVTKIASSTFSKNKLISINIPDSVTEIGSAAFADNQLTSVILPNSVTEIGIAIFNQNQLTNINIPNSVTTIGDFAFADNQLTNIVIPDSVTIIKEQAFYKNPLTNVVVDSNNSIYDSRDNCNAIIETSSNTLIQGSKNTIIPNTVTTIGDFAFDCIQLTSINIPNSVTTIGSSAFLNAELTSINLPDSVTEIGSSAFAHNQLTNISLPNSVMKIAVLSFAYNQLTSINIPDSVTTIGSEAFSNNNLNYVYIGSNSKLTSIGSEAFSSSNNTFGDFVDNPNLKVIYNNSGKAFDWNKIVNNESGTSFVTGTTNTRTSGSITYNPVEIKTGTP